MSDKKAAEACKLLYRWVKAMDPLAKILMADDIKLLEETKSFIATEGDSSDADDQNGG